MVKNGGNVIMENERRTHNKVLPKAGLTASIGHLWKVQALFFD